MSRIKDLTGQKFNKLTVVELSPNKFQKTKSMWLCKCDCGNATEVRGTNLTSGHTKTCGYCPKNTYEVKGDFVIVKDSNGVAFEIDFDDFKEVKRHTWIFHNRYVKTNVSKKIKNRKSIEYLHRFLMNPPQDMYVDHIDRNPLNNRRSNLRVCTHSENARNFVSKRVGKTSRFKGVCRKGNRWIACIHRNGKSMHLGTFDTEIEAGKAYNKKAKEIDGEFARLNEI